MGLGEGKRRSSPGLGPQAQDTEDGLEKMTTLGFREMHLGRLQCSKAEQEGSAQLHELPSLPAWLEHPCLRGPFSLTPSHMGSQGIAYGLSSGARWETQVRACVPVIYIFKR